ncbi:ABC transporter permease [Aeromicrobium sp. Leaf291]|uniref:ABC transporter permease n=1 Tax=Aeromicrobium sp. Leaf291 TaxID=1736325 RepID=UPI0007003D32|nr:ABC transporter permease [Aeromicrobium sp. Leaf291]KQP84184.1 ribose ABC transporter permease [Aeromicrobium sp. Leaf291]
MTTTAEKSTAPHTARPARRLPAGLPSRLALPAVWVVTIVIFSILRPDTFATSANWSSMLSTQSVFLILTLGLIVPLTTGDIDLSLAYTLTLSSVTVAVLNVNHGWPIGFAIVAAILVGSAMGLLNGVLATLCRIDPIIVTLGTGTFAYGVTLMISGSSTVPGIDVALSDWTVGNSLLGIPIQFYYALLAVVVLWYVMEFTTLGRRMLIVGRGRSVARLSGLRVDRVRVGALVTGGTLAGVAGVMYAGTSGSADPTSGPSFLLPVFAGAFLGATAIMPGRFNAWGTLVATYFLATGITGLQFLGAENYVQQLFYGGALVVAVGLSQLVTRGSAPISGSAA